MKRSLFLVLLGACSAAAPVRPSFPDVDALPVRAELPDPLVLLDGRKVTSAEQWRSERRPELQALFQHYMYGFLPPAPAKVEVAVRRTDPKALGGKATLQELTLSWAPAPMPSIDLLLVVPNGRSTPVPCVFGLNFNGNHAVLPDPLIKLPTVWLREQKGRTEKNRALESGRGLDTATWSIEASIDRGYAVATFVNADVAPDKHDWNEGVHKHYFKPGQTEPGPHEWGTIAAWAWGLHRVVDYLVTNPAIDAKRLACFGHSRNGKTALVAAAYDERIALAIPHQAGCGGTAPSRGKVGEQVRQINKAFPHWFNDTFVRFNEQVERLPFDQNGLVAICAPRPVLFTNALEDQWANPDGQYAVLQAADPVYRLFGKAGLMATSAPRVGDALSLGALGCWIRAGKHSTTPEDWKIFLDYCDVMLVP
jgi:hypothetical protein